MILGKLKLSDEMKLKLEAVTGGSRKSSMSSSRDSKERTPIGNFSGDGSEGEKEVKKLEENRKILLEQKLGGGKNRPWPFIAPHDCFWVFLKPISHVFVAFCTGSPFHDFQANWRNGTPWKRSTGPQKTFQMLPIESILVLEKSRCHHLLHPLIIQQQRIAVVVGEGSFQVWKCRFIFRRRKRRQTKRKRSELKRSNLWKRHRPQFQMGHPRARRALLILQVNTHARLLALFLACLASPSSSLKNIFWF